MIFKTEVCLYTTFVRKYDHLIILRHFNPISNNISGRKAGCDREEQNPTIIVFKTFFMKQKPPMKLEKNIT